nr:PREDICTED: protein maelstrom homolog isoform X1 [Linepithema humile]
MPKKKSKNAFFFFMSDWKKRAEAEGREFPNGFKDVQADPDCNAEWQSLTKQQKGPYEAMAKKDKIASQISNADKKTTYGESINMLDEKEKEQRKLMKNMQENIKLAIDSAVKLNILPKLKFCFVHVNWFFSTIVDNNITYFPAEYAIGVFSLENGIEDVHHVIVSAKIPLGFRREALETSQTTHNIPVEYPGGETDFATMYRKLVDFLEPRKTLNKYPPLYTTNNCMGAVQSLLTRLTNAAQKDSEQFKVYELESLFIHLANEAYKKRTDREIKYIPAYAKHIFTRFTYIFESGFECSFHKFTDGGCKCCSQSVLQQWAWTLCEEFCKPLEVIMRPKTHYPIKPDSTPEMTYSMSNMKIEDDSQLEAESNAILSMTGVSEQHRLKVSTRTYQDEIRRRNDSKQIEVIDHSKLDVAGDKADKCKQKYLDEKSTRLPGWMQPSNSGSLFASTSTMNYDKNDEKHFPVIVAGRGISFRSQIETAKAPLGKGQGHS